LLHKRFLALVGATVGIGLFFGSMQVSVTAFAVSRDSASLAGPLYSITSLISLVAGIAYGARRWRTPARRQYVVAFAILFVTSLPLLVVNSPVALGLALALPGLALAPIQVLASVLVESEVEPAVLTQAFTWLNSGSAAGIAMGAAVAGRAVDTHGSQLGFALAIAATLVATGMAVVVRQR
jgi:MFS family permease